MGTLHELQDRLASELEALRGRVAELEGVAREHESCRRALRASEQRLRDLADGSIQGILVHRDFRILYVNPAFAQMMGYADADELLGKDLLRELESSLAPEQRRALYEARLRGEPVPERFEVARPRKDGGLMWMEMLVRVVEWEGAPAVQATCQDITPYRRALDELRESEQRFRDFAEVSSDWFWETGPDHRFTYISDRFAQVAGLRAEDLMGRARWELARPESDPMDWSEHRADLEARRAIRNFHFSYYDSAGRRRFVSINGKPIFTDDGLFLGYRGTGTDITAQMEAHEAAARAHARLIDAIENMPAAFALYDVEDRLVLINSKVRQWFAGYADCFQLGRRYEELIRCVAKSGHVRDALRDPEAWCRERIGLFHNPPERLEVALTDGRWVRSLDRRTSEGGTVAIRIDITELKHAEEALRGSEQRFKDFAEVASDWFWEMGPDLRFSFFSERFAEVTGLDPGTCLGLQRWEMPRPEHDRVDWEAHQENLARRRPFRGFVYPYFDRDGLVRHARISGKPVFASDGAFLGYRGTGTDITAEVEARQEADRAHARLVDAVESIPAAFLLFDREHRLLLCNEKSKEYFPHLAHLFAVGTSLIDIARYAAAHGLVAEAIGREEEWVRERLRQFDNPPPTLEQLRLPERRWLQVLDRKTREGGMVSIRMDITELKQREEELRKSEERFRGLAEGSIQAIIVHRLFNPLFVNQAFVDMFGYASAEEVLAIDMRDLPYIAPTERERLMGYAHARLRGEPAPSRFRFEGLRKDGTPVWAEVVASTVKWDGELAILGTYTDITDLMKSEEAHRKSEEKYRNLVDGSIQGILVHRDFKPLFANQAYAKVFGYETAEEILELGSVERILQPAERARVTAIKNARMKGEPAPVQYEFQGIRKDGTAVWIDSINSVIEWDEQPAILSTQVNVTERKLAAQALRESETRFRTLVEGSVQGILVHRDFKPLFVNQAFADIFGFPSREAALALPDITGTFEPADLEWTRQRNRDQFEGRRVPLVVERRVIRADQSIGWVEALPTVVEWEGEPAFLVSYVDITDRKRAEEALRASEERYRKLVEHSLQGMVVVREEAVIFANRAEAEMFGFASPDEMIGTPFNDRIAPEELDRLVEYRRKRLRGERAPNHYEFRGIRKDGRTVWVEVLADAILWEGQPAVQAVHLDITERKRGEQVLRESEQRFRDLVEGSLEGIIIHRDFKPLFVNEAMANICGYESPEEMLALESTLQVHAPQERERVQAYYRARIRGEEAPARYEMQWLRKDGRAVWVAVQSRLIEWQGAPAVQSTVIEITERKRAEEELRSSRELLQTVFDALPLWVSVKNKEGYYLMVNRKRQAETGLTAEQYRRLHTLQLPYATEEILQKTVQRDRRVIETGEALDFEYEMLLPDGRFRIHHTFKLPLRGPRGEIVGVVAVAEDITERKMLEDQLRQAQKMEAIGQLAGGVAHDFNNLLQIISGYCQFALSEIGDSQIKRDLHEVVAATERGSHLTRQLLAFGRRHLLHRVDIHINDAILNLAGMLKRLFEEHIELLVVPGKDLAPVHADAGLIEQVLMNLCLNARDAMPKGGVLTISSENVELDRAFCEGSPWAQPGRYVRITVADTGEGIRPEHLERVFEPFFTTKNLGKGTGLGLAMAYGIVKQHNGIIRAESEPGKGARFTIFLPVATGVGAEARAVEPSVPLGGHETILVAEDEPRVRDMTERVLRGAGYAVLTASNGDEAVALLETQRIDLVVLDVIMPKKDGRTVYEIIRARMRDVPVLFCSGYSTVALGDALLREDNVRLIQKPYLAEELLHVVRAVLDRRPEPGETGPPAP
jgi:PAS domain S-box-containing protein